MMIEKENLDVRTITMGISLLDCIDTDLARLKKNIYEKIYESARDLVKVGNDISGEYGIPIVNKRISVTPVSLIGASACHYTSDYVEIARTLDRAARDVGVNFLGGYSALVSKGMTQADRMLIESIPDALSQTDVVCSSVNVGSTRTGIDMDAVRLMGGVIKEDGGAHSGQRFLWLRQAGRLLQRAGRQPLYGGRLPRGHRGGPDPQHRCQRPGCGKACPGRSPRRGF